MEASGLTETVHRDIGYCSNIFLYAIAGGRADFDPTAAAKKQLKPLPKEKHMAATTDPAEVGRLLNMIDGYTGSFVVRSALLLAPLVFVRPGELRNALWSDIDFDRREWRYTASKTKQPHVVPLSRQAVDILKELHQATGRGEFVFPSATSSTREMSNNAVLAAYRRMGIEKDELCGHGWRAIARTLLDEELKFPLPIIEMQLAHSVKDMHGRAYNRTTFIKDRHEMMQTWADYLDGLKVAASKSTSAGKLAA
jgi:integrase